MQAKFLILPVITLIELSLPFAKFGFGSCIGLYSHGCVFYNENEEYNIAQPSLKH